jgi:regulation of enolase protein 1 (concanavalin A-like superfamily)
MTWLDETFAAPTPDPRLRWSNPPPAAGTGPDGLVVRTAAATDFWQGTHYGFRVDNGHLLAAGLSGDFRLETLVHGTPLHQYDQAGLMVRLSPQCWLKTSVEFEPGEPSRLGAVVTNVGWSDWSTQSIDPEAGRQVAFRITRRGADYLVEAALGQGAGWSQIRLARLNDDTGGEVTAGLYACSPKEAGFAAAFRYLRVERL